MKNFIKNYNYSLLKKKNFYNYLGIILPFKMELMIILFNLKKKSLKGTVLSFYFYFKRVFLFINSDLRQFINK